MRLASADRHSIVKWLWGVLGVFAWVLLASVLGASPASADDRQDALEGRTTHSAHAAKVPGAWGKNDGARPEARTGTDGSHHGRTDNTDRAPKKPQAHKNPQLQNPQAHKNPHTTAPARNSAVTKPLTVARDVIVAKTSAASGPNMKAAQSEAERTSAPSPRDTKPKVKSERAWTGPHTASNPKPQIASHEARDFARSTLTAVDKGRTARWHHAAKSEGRGYAVGHAKEKANWFSDAAMRHWFDNGAEGTSRRQSIEHARGQERSDGASSRDAVSLRDAAPPAPATSLQPQTVINTSAPASTDAPADTAPATDAPISDQPPLTEQWTAPGGAGASAAGATQFQVASDAITSDPQVASVLLGIRTSTDDRVPSGPTSSTDSYPD